MSEGGGWGRVTMSPVDRISVWLLALVNVQLGNAIVWFVAEMGWRGSFLLLLACPRLRKYDGNIPSGARRLSAE